MKCTMAATRAIRLAELVGTKNVTTRLSRATVTTGCSPITTQQMLRPCLLNNLPLHRREFHSTPLNGAKKNKKGKYEAESSFSNSSSSGKSQPSPEEPLNFDDLEEQLKKLEERYQERVKKLKSGSRFNPDMIRSLQVQVDKKTGAKYALREVARVEPGKGRAVSIMVHEEAYIKPVMSAIQNSPQFNQQPQPSPDNELELIMKVELQSRDDIVKEIKAVCHQWREDIRGVRRKRVQLFSKWRKEKLLLPDDERRAEQALDKLIKAKGTDIDNEENTAIKACENMK